MAIRTISNAGGSWTSVGTWVEGAIPTSTDDVVCTATSGNLSMPAGTLDCLSINLTGYTGTWSGALSTTLRIRGDVTFGGTITTTLTLQQNINNITITSNGISWTGSYQFNTSAITATLSGNLTILGNLTMGSNTFLGGDLFLGGSLVINNNTGTGGGTITLNGTGSQTWTGNFRFRHGNLVVNKPSGAFVISGQVQFDTGIFTYITAGSYSVAGSTLRADSSGSYNSGALQWNNVTFNISQTLLSNMTVNGSFSSSNPNTYTGFQLILNGNITVAQATTGTTTWLYSGTGIWSGAGIIGNAFTINTAGTLTVSGTVGASNLTHVSGLVVTTGSTLVGATTTTNWNISAITWNNVTMSASTYNLISVLNCSGTLTMGIANTVTITTSNINCSGSISMPSQIATGVITINMTGTGTWSGIGQLRTNLIFKSTCNIGIIGVVQYNTGTMTAELGSQVNTGNSTILTQATATTTFDLSNIKLYNFTLGGTSTQNTLQLNSPLYITNVASLGASSQPQTINGSFIYVESGTVTSGTDNGGQILGTSQVHLTGDKAAFLDGASTLANGQPIWQIPITINIRGICLMTGRLNLGPSSSLSILNGKIDHRNGRRNVTTLVITSSITLINVDRCKFKSIIVSTNQILTMNEFFSGSPEYKSVIRIQGGATNIRVNFTDRTPKKAFFISLRNFTLLAPYVNQLTVINRDGNAGLNQGILFGDDGREGFPINRFPTEPSYSFGDGFQSGGMNY